MDSIMHVGGSKGEREGTGGQSDKKNAKITSRLEFLQENVF